MWGRSTSVFIPDDVRFCTTATCPDVPTAPSEGDGWLSFRGVSQFGGDIDMLRQAITLPASPCTGTLSFDFLYVPGADDSGLFRVFLRSAGSGVAEVELWRFEIGVTPGFQTYQRVELDLPASTLPGEHTIELRHEYDSSDHWLAVDEMTLTADALPGDLTACATESDCQGNGVPDACEPGGPCTNLALSYSYAPLDAFLFAQYWAPMHALHNPPQPPPASVVVAFLTVVEGDFGSDGFDIVYGIQNHFLNGSGPFLVRVDRSGTSFFFPEAVGTTGIGAPVTGMTWDPASSTMYVSTQQNLYTVNLQTGAASLVGPFGGAVSVQALASDCLGNLYAYDGVGRTLGLVNKLTGGFTTRGPCTANGSSISMDFDDRTRTLWLVARQQNGPAEYRTVDTMTGTSTLVASGSSGPWGWIAIANSCKCDCDADEVPDECQIASDPDLDCNRSGVLDACEIASGAATDCDNDGVPDICAVVDFFPSVSYHDGAGAQIPPGGPPVCRAFSPADEGTVEDVQLYVEISHDDIGQLEITLAHAGESVALWDNDCPGESPLLVEFADWGGDPACDLLTDPGILRQPTELLRATGPGMARFSGSPVAGDWTLCVRDEFQLEVGYLDNWRLTVATPPRPFPVLPDCDRDGQSDFCAIAAGAADCNSNEVPDTCDLADTAAQVFHAAPFLAIPDNSPVGIESTISVPDEFTIGDLDVSFILSHSFLGDLCVELVHPSGSPTVQLLARPGANVPGEPCHDGGPLGCGANDYGYVVLDDEGEGGPLEAICANGTTSPPTYTPFEPLSAFDGLPAGGTWRLRVYDRAQIDTGQLVKWSLSVRKQASSDCNDDQIPDECEALPDCDGDGLGDSCELTRDAVFANLEEIEIPPYPPGVQSSLLVPQDLLVQGVIVELELQAGAIGDLCISLEHDGRSVLLLDRPGAYDLEPCSPRAGIGECLSTFALDVVIDDAGAGGPIEDVCPWGMLASPPGFQPAEPLAEFDGLSSSGIWTLTLNSPATLAGGVLKAWRLRFPGAIQNDCNENSMPDDCELTADPTLDCDQSGTIDSCQITGGTATDCDHDGLLDGCVIVVPPPPASVVVEDFEGVLIPDAPGENVPGPAACRTITVIEEGYVNNVEVFVQIAHDWIGDLNITLMHDGASVTLWDRDCYDENYLIANFLDSGGDPACTELASFALRTPTELLDDRGPGLARFRGMTASGEWTLCIVDEYIADTGELLSWQLSIGVSDRGFVAPADCNFNHIPDNCDIADETSVDCQPDGIPDECQLDGGARILFDQPGIPGDVGTGPASFTAWSASCPHGTATADNFALPQDAILVGVEWTGVYYWADYPGIDADFRLTIYADDGHGGLGPIVADFPHLSVTKTPATRAPLLGTYVVYDYSAVLPTSVLLAGGQAYWLSVNVNPSGSEGPAFMWLASPDDNSPSPLPRPSPRQTSTATCAGLPPASMGPTYGDGGDYDLAFRLLGPIAGGNDCDGNGVPDECGLATTSVTLDGLFAWFDARAAVVNGAARGAWNDRAGNTAPSSILSGGFREEYASPEAVYAAPGQVGEIGAGFAEVLAGSAGAVDGINAAVPLIGLTVEGLMRVQWDTTTPVVQVFSGGYGMHPGAANPPGERIWSLQQQNSNRLQFLVQGNTPGSVLWYGVETAADLPNDKWFHVVAIFDGTRDVNPNNAGTQNVVIYINGVAVPQAATAVHSGDQYAGPLNSGALGRPHVLNFTEGDPQAAFMRFYSRGLTEAEVAANWADAREFFSSPPPADCNDSGVADVCDLAAETSMDVNANGVPDECEPDLICSEPGNLLVNGCFETPEAVAGWPTTYGDWGMDVQTIVGPENGITPFVGSNMLRLETTGPDGSASGISADAAQLLDLSPFAAHVANGTARLRATARVNRVPGGATSDTEFRLYLWAYDLPPAQFGPQWANHRGTAATSLLSDADPGTWELIETELVLPAGSTMVAVVVSAFENVVDDPTGPELDGHYADRVTLHLEVLETGACCLADSTCIESSREYCEDHAYGTYAGDETFCEPGFCPAAQACIESYEEDYEDGTLDPRWNLSGSVSELGGKLVMTVPNGGAPAYTYLDSTNRVLCGDFDVQVDFDATQMPVPTTGVSRWAAIAVYRESDDTPVAGMAVFTIRAGSTCVPWTQSYKAWTTNPVECPTGSPAVHVQRTTNTGRLRLTRTGDVLRMMYLDGTLWRQVKVDRSDEQNLKVVMFVDKYPYDSPGHTVSFDNLSIENDIADICSPSFVDEFEDGDISGDVFSGSGATCGIVEESGGRLRLGYVTGCTSGATYVRGEHEMLCGDFDVRVDFDTTQMPGLAPGAGARWAGFGVIAYPDGPGGSLSGQAARIERYNECCVGGVGAAPAPKVYKAWSTTLGSGNDVAEFAATTDDIARFRATREGDVITLWYWNGAQGDWSALLTEALTAAPMVLYMNTDDVPNNVAYNVYFDNLQVVADNTFAACCLPDGSCTSVVQTTCTQSLGGVVLAGSSCPAEDCDDNGLADACELANGLTSDCNGDGVPDACQISDWTAREPLRVTPIPFFPLNHELAADGARLLVTAPDEPCAAGDACGAAYVFEFDGAQWNERQRLTPADLAAGLFFGASVAISGDYAVIGAPGADCLEQDCGAAYVFHYDGSAWIEQQKLVASDASLFASFGHSVALSGPTALVGAPHRQSEPGAVYVFDRNGSLWTETQVLVASDASPSDWFGVSIAMQDRRALIGGPLAVCSAGSFCGAAYFYARNGAEWEQHQKVSPSETQEFGLFGGSVAMDGASAMIAAPRAGCGPGTEPCGSVYAYSLVNGTWQLSQVLGGIVSDGTIVDSYGLTLDAGRAALAHRGNAGGVVLASIYEQTGSTWQEVATANTEPASGSFDALAVELSGDFLLATSLATHGETGQLSHFVWQYRRGRDCDANLVLDECEGAADCDANQVPDLCEMQEVPAKDCNTNGILDLCEIAIESPLDCNGNGMIDACELATEPSLDCDANGRLDSCDIVDSPAADCDVNGVPDVCEAFEDCNANGLPDGCEYGTFIWNESFEGSTVTDGSWIVLLVDAQSWAGGELGGTLTVMDIEPAAEGVNAEVVFTRSVPPTDDFLIRTHFSWDAGGLLTAMDGVSLSARSGGITIAEVRYQDGWLASAGQFAFLGESFSIGTGPDTAALSGETEFIIGRRNGVIRFVRDGQVIVSDTNLRELDSIQLRFRYFPAPGPQPSTIGTLGVDFVEVRSDPVNDCNFNGIPDDCDVESGTIPVWPNFIACLSDPCPVEQAPCPPAPGQDDCCTALDEDADGGIDLRDFVELQRRIGGP